MDKDEYLIQKLDEFKKEKERIRNIVIEIVKKNNRQQKMVSLIFIILIGTLLILGIVLQKITLFFTLEIIGILGIFKLIWIFYELQRASHFQFWILNSLEFRMNEIDRKVKKIEKMLKDKNYSKIE